MICPLMSLIPSPRRGSDFAKIFRNFSKYADRTLFPPLPHRKRAVLLGRGLRSGLRDGLESRNSRHRFPESSRIAPAFCEFSRIFVDFLMFVLSPCQANLGASRTISRSLAKMWSKVRRFFTASRSSNALESPIAKNT